MGRVTVHWGEFGLTCMRNGDNHGAIIETLHWGSHVRFLPPFFYGWLRTQGSKNLFSNTRQGGSKRKVLVAKVAV